MAGQVSSGPAEHGRAGLLLRGASFAHLGTRVLENSSLEIPRGQTAVVRGPNGAGKSTLLFVCAGFLRLQAGTIELAGEKLDPDDPGKLFRRGMRMGFVFQEGGLLSNMNVLANVAIALRYHADLLGISLAEVEARAVAALERVQVRKTDYYTLPAHLSFGVRRRLALARAIALNPNFFFFDDPDVGLDQQTAALVHEILCQYRDDPQVTTLVATNRDLLIDRLASPTYVLEGGQLVRAHPTVA